MKRRAFLQNAAVVVTPLLLPHTFDVLSSTSLCAYAKRNVVFVHLNGGNDGYNTIVPHTDKAYYKLRPNIAVQPTEVIRLTERYGFHPSLAGLKPWYDQGNMLIVPNATSANLDNSHHTCFHAWKNLLVKPLTTYPLDQKQIIEFSAADLGLAASDFEEKLLNIASSISTHQQRHVYAIGLDGFDTHQFQKVKHAFLLQAYADAMNTFMNRLKALDELNNTMIITWSEFGRSLAENNRKGTDHGHAGVLMIYGGQLQHSGIYSNQETNASGAFDVSTVYANILGTWLGGVLQA
ncbi:DUF1501 domain-containing protein [Mucilaginibacter sp. PAMB04274]|uniref:DUF1501 domain-containing protein n=1 Tax=Mucilaginibacter sp. PAMB04274 TaxID=3138568 RepID=UPI0031F68825